MTPFALALVLTAACCHATWNILVKRINSGPELVWLFSFLSTLIYLPAALWILVVQQPVLGPLEFAFCFVSGILHTGYFLLLQKGYSKGDISLVYPTARATGPLLSTSFAVMLLGEHLTWPIILGGLTIITGVVFITGGFKRGAEHATRSLVFGVSVGLIIGCYTVWDAYTVRALLIPPLLLDYASNVVRAAALTPYAVTRWHKVAHLWREHRLAVIAIAVLSSLGYILVLAAFTFTPVVYVAPVREVSVLITVMAGTLLLGEGDFRKRMGWACLILFGMILLATG